MTRFRLGIVIGMCLLLMTGLLSGCAEMIPPRLKVVTGTSLIANIVEDISGDKVVVRNVIPPGSCPGHYDIKPGEIETLAEGDVYTLLGPSGCGKTTILRCVAGLETPESGEIVLGDQVMYSSSTHKSVPTHKRNIGMLFQSYAIWPHLNIFNNVAFPLIYGQGNYSKKEIGECQRAWKEFLNTISASTIAEVTDNDIFLFNDVIWKKYKRDSLSSTWIRGRFTRIKTILKFYIKRGRDNRAEIRRVLDLCASFELPPKTGKLAQAISKSNFQTLIDNADVKWKLIYLLGLNCGYYASDISNLKRDYIRSEEGVTYTVYPRPKNAGIRINVFWDITVATYKEYLRECDFISPYLFKNVAGGKLTEHSIRRGFARRRRHLGLPSSLKFENLRDGAASAMFGRVADKELRNVTLGHRISDEEERYITLHPEMVRQCSDAIYQHYFA